jgi:hypothetical protein
MEYDENMYTLEGIKSQGMVDRPESRDDSYKPPPSRRGGVLCLTLSMVYVCFCITVLCFLPIHQKVVENQQQLRSICPEDKLMEAVVPTCLAAELVSRQLEDYCHRNPEGDYVIHSDYRDNMLRINVLNTDHFD